MPQLPENWPGMTLGQRLAWRRKSLRTTQARMAAATGLSLDRLQRLEWDRGILAPAEIAPLLQGYDLTPGQWLLGLRDDHHLLQVAHTSPHLAARIALLFPEEVAAIDHFVVNLTEGRRHGEP